MVTDVTEFSLFGEKLYLAMIENIFGLNMEKSLEITVLY